MTTKTESRNVYTATPGSGLGADADPITTEVIRHALNSAAGQMKRTLVRTAFSPIIYEVLDFGLGIYDREVRLLAEAPALPLFRGTMNFCIEAAVEAAGGEDALDEGDILIYNWPYGTGSHAQDTALVMPVFVEGELVGYTAIKQHYLDIGALAPYCSDTTDVFQEGTFFPGVKLVRRGEFDDTVYRILLANSRMPIVVEGDMNAQVNGCRVGAAQLRALIERHGLDTFRAACERMLDHGEQIMRQRIEAIPDGVYRAATSMDDDIVSGKPIEFEVVVEVDGSAIRVDYSNAPEPNAGPMNSPLAATVSATRLALSLLAGPGEAPNDGMFRPIEIVTRPGSMFHPAPPAACFLYAWPVTHAVDVIYRALAQASPEGVPACSGSDVAGFISWGIDPRIGEPWGDGPPCPLGQGGHAGGDGASALLHYAFANGRGVPAEVYETKTTWMVLREELAVDSCGAGEHRGGLGMDKLLLSVDDSTHVTGAIDRTLARPWGLFGGTEARPNGATVTYPDGTQRNASKATLNVPAGATLLIGTAGGGGYGDPSKRDPDAVKQDLANGYITEAHARAHYPHALGDDID